MEWDLNTGSLNSRAKPLSTPFCHFSGCLEQYLAHITFLKKKEKVTIVTTAKAMCHHDPHDHHFHHHVNVSLPFSCP